VITLGTLAFVLGACPAPTPAPVDGSAASDVASSADAESPDATSDDAPAPRPFFDARAVPPSTQRAGDPDAGYQALVNNGYVSCGVPYSAYIRVIGAAPEASRLPGRTGHNAELPYNFTASTTPSGVEVVAPNCLSCHAGAINGQLVIGLGNASGDFTTDPGLYARLSGGFVTDPAERVEWQRWSERVLAIGGYVRTRTIGVNPADNIAAALFAHRDRHTLAWSREPLLEMPPYDPVPVDVPPWWRMARKNAMFYNAAGRGDHARIMMTASTLCTDSIAEARAIDAYFNDVRAYIAQLRPPAWPFTAPDASRAARGRTVFTDTCARCHGTYGEGGSYPNLLVSLGEVGTDDMLARGSSQFAGRFVEWFNQSFYGETARLEPQDGYLAPPLDGIWATAPYLHNGSVPTIAALLESPTRPQFWTRNFETNAYDTAAVGMRFTALESGQEAETDAQRRVRIYDTTLPGYSNAGHTFGDALTDAERRDLLEYLKTL
jgi:cytochrome c5